MNVIFLDVDGVLNSECFEESCFGQSVDPACVARLARLVAAANAKLVLHSGWRMWFDAQMAPQTPEAAQLVEVLRAHHLELNDQTPDHTTEEIRAQRRFSLVKGREIRGWLAAHPETGGWLVLDDLDLNDEVLAPHHLRTDPAVGLTDADVENGLKILNKSK